MVHFNWTQLIPGVGHEYIHVATALITGMFLILISLVARVALGSNEAAITPASRLSVKGFFEVFVEAIYGFTDQIIGHEGRKFVPMFATIFLYIWFNNLMGLIPGMTPATDNINTNIAVGLFAFVAYHAYGLKEHKGSYVKQFTGPILPSFSKLATFIPAFIMMSLMFVIESISHAVRPFSLSLRLQGNMIGDHTVLSIFLDLVPFPFVNENFLAILPVPVVFYLLGLFVCTLQAFIFTMLSALFIGMSAHGGH